MATIQTDMNGLEYVLIDGERRYLTCLPPKDDSGFQKFQAGRTIPRGEWREVDNEPYLTAIKDQNGRGACVGHGSVTALEVAINQAGRTKRQLSAWFCYSQINGGMDNGAVVSDALQSLKQTGTCLDSSVKYATYIKSQISQSAYTEAERFKVKEGYQLTTFDELASAIQLGFTISFGICIGGRFSPNSDGIIPQWNGQNTGGHCMAGLGLKQINGKWYVKVANSWGTNWGKGGWCFMDESYFTGQRYGLDAFAIEAAAHDPQDPGLTV